jgi:hypothetical protein
MLRMHLVRRKPVKLMRHNFGFESIQDIEIFSFYFIFFFLARDRNDLDMFIGFLTVGIQDWIL